MPEEGAQGGAIEPEAIVIETEEAIVVEPDPAAPATDDSQVGALTAFADADEILGEAPHAVHLDVEVIPGTGHPPFTYRWDFGDATPFSSEKAPGHTYEIPGDFRASVIVTDSKGEVDQDFVDITVTQALPPGAMTVDELRKKMPPEKILEEIRRKREADKAPSR